MRPSGVALRIRQIRQKLGFNQAQFGERLGVTRLSVARYEAGRIPKWRILEDISRMGEVTVAWLLHGQIPGIQGRPDPPQILSPGLSEPVRTLVAFLERKTPSLGRLSKKGRNRYEQRVEELVTRTTRELEEYQKLLEATRSRAPGALRRRQMSRAREVKRE